ncbi:hemolysin family protein [Weissella confusa]|uniref:HlyC/CorC family transporter n=3 Tax=Weissella confusa TaxID=1583 RepID=A0A4Z0RJP0_WEICO|nr:hemolysin family protein [Weissella confusa]COJ24768.1 CBS domain-containing protein [Streptococcus pneumoniae]MBD1492385.1 HlyC/CorC family transporter [Weissella confusa]MBD5832923.1 HlyC/CorC family transporter [Weissella confusa]MBF7058864.1 HlyC/CorC family transporter [Weissella confusa]MBJ7616742.1 HlyC/CorC family transporter [Weissella confusa]
MSEGELLISVIVIILVLLFATLFVAAEFALVKVRKSALVELQEEREKPSRQIATAIHMVENLNEYLSTTQVGITLAGLILGWMGEETIAHLLLEGGFLKEMTGASAGVIASVIALVFLTYVEVVFTELVPKNVAIDFPVKVALFVATPLRLFHVIFYPFVWLLNVSATGVTRLMGMKPANEGDEVYSEAEILSLSRTAARSGELDDADYVFMQRAFEMNDKVAVDIMIDRTQLDVVDITDSVHDTLQRYFETKHSRFPVVADNDKDKILGYVFNYDLMRQAQIDDTLSVRKIIRHMPTVPENMPIQDVLQKMIARRTPIVIVKDEYGGTSGIVTDKDIYEELFGSVRDEMDAVADDLVEKLGADDAGNMHYKVSGKMTLYDFERYFHADIRPFDDSDMVTLTGFFLDENSDTSAGDTIKVLDFEITALDFKDAYINEFEVVRVAPTTDDDMTIEE